jgi:hypothetical protein
MHKGNIFRSGTRDSVSQRKISPKSAESPKCKIVPTTATAANG